MLNRAVVLLVISLSIIASVGPAVAEKAAEGSAVDAVAAARAGDWSKAYAEAGKSKDAAAQKLVRWLDYSRANTGARFGDIAAFIDANPDWPWRDALLRRAEAALATESDNVAADWLKRHPPISGVGKIRAAELLIKQGKAADGAAALRAAWIGSDFSAPDERAVTARFAALLRPEDHRKRLDRLLWDRDSDAARRMLPLVAADYRKLAEARLALLAGVGNPAPAIARLPGALRADPGLAFDEARWDLKKDKYAWAAQILLAHSDNPVRPEVWWKERMQVARHLLAAGNPELAYRLVDQPGANKGEASPDAEFLSGYIALRFRKDAARAYDDFANIIGRAVSPYAKSRAAYWAGRAAIATDKKDLAVKWYTLGAENMATFYGQLAAHQLGKDAPPHPVPEPPPGQDELAKFQANELVRATELLFAVGDRGHAGTFLLKLTSQAKSALDFSMLATLAEEHRRIDLAIAVARRAVAAGMPLMMHGYPVTALPAGTMPERSLLLAIVRQESAFAPQATSPVGARGLMQLMPATARLVAGKLQLPFSLARLTSDGIYNVTLGRSYLETLLDDFGGSYPLAIAAYNAGPGRVRQWLHDFGDPRGSDINMVDWIEMIPFQETRSYVHRVLENLQIYRGQEGDNAAAFSLMADLSR